METTLPPSTPSSPLLLLSPLISCDTEKVLLAWAKDERYLQYMQSLLRDVLCWDNNNNDNDEDASSSSTTAWYIGSMLTILLLVGRHGKTRGMEACGLTYHHHPSNRRSRMILVMILAATMRFLLQRLATTATTTTTSSLQHQDETTAANQRLRGEARRRFHEQQRQAMLQRATAPTFTISTTMPTESTPSPTSATDATTPILGTSAACLQAACTNNNNSFSWARKKIQSCCLAFAKSLGLALAMPQEGPHALSSATQQLQQQSLGFWLLRLFLAYYCFYGRYPNWMHQPVEVLQRKNHHGNTFVDEASSSSLALRKPTSIQLVAWFTGMQAAATLLQNLSRLTIRWWILPLMLPPSAVRGGNDDTGVTARDVVNQVFGATTTTTAPASNRPPPSHNAINMETDSSASSSWWWCGICRMPCNSSNPALPLAAPVTCGHVFCWDCLMSWLCRTPMSTASSTTTITITRSECPLCRAPCTPQQVMALYYF